MTNFLRLALKPLLVVWVSLVLTIAQGMEVDIFDSDDESINDGDCMAMMDDALMEDQGPVVQWVDHNGLRQTKMVDEAAADLAKAIESDAINFATTGAMDMFGAAMNVGFLVWMIVGALQPDQDKIIIDKLNAIKAELDGIKKIDQENLTYAVDILHLLQQDRREENERAYDDEYIEQFAYVERNDSGVPGLASELRTYSRPMSDFTERLSSLELIDAYIAKNLSLVIANIPTDKKLMTYLLTEPGDGASGPNSIHDESAFGLLKMYLSDDKDLPKCSYYETKMQNTLIRLIGPACTDGPYDKKYIVQGEKWKKIRDTAFLNITMSFISHMKFNQDMLSLLLFQDIYRNCVVRGTSRATA